MKTLQFEAVKVAMKQDKTGIILTLNVHPDEVPEDLLRDFVGARYQVVMVRLNGEEKPMQREQEYQRDPVRAAGILCRNQDFARFLSETGNIEAPTQEAVIDWLKQELGIQSRAELKEKHDAARRFWSIKQEFELWTQSV